VITCLRDLMHVTGCKPICFYCGGCATTIDHILPKHGVARSKKPGRPSNIKPSCRRCNSRKGSRTLESFRARLERLAALAAKSNAAGPVRAGLVKFYGEGARGPSLQRTRLILDRVAFRKRKLVIMPPGETLPPYKSAKEQKAARDVQATKGRWRGRFTFSGSRALRALSSATGCSFPVIERFMLKQPVRSADQIVAACKKLKLNVGELRALKPRGPRPKQRRRKPGAK